VGGRHVMVDDVCKWCGKTYRVKRTKFLAGMAKYCSKKCFNDVQRAEGKSVRGYEKAKVYWDGVKWNANWHDEDGKIRTSSYQKWWWQVNVGEVPKGLFVYLKDGNNENIDPSNFAVGTRHDISMANRQKQMGKVVPSGKDSHLWRDGRSKATHPPEFTRALKREVFERDNKKCRVCGKSVVPLGERIVHHINANKNDNSLENLILVCKSCHGKIHANNIISDPVILAFRSQLYT
jgi:hypothetical protein